MTRRAPVFGSGSGVTVRAVVPRRDPRRRGAGLFSAAGCSAAFSPGVVAGDSVPVLAVSAGCSFVEVVRLLPRAGRRGREVRAGLVVSGFVTSAGSSGVAV